VVLALVDAGCHSPDGTSTDVRLQYEPPFAPVKLSVGTDGISLSDSQSIVTPAGIFSIEEDVSHSLTPRANTIDLVIRHKRAGSIVDEAFTVGDQEVEAVVDGQNTFHVTNSRIFIDASQGTVRSIEVRSAAPRPPTPRETIPAGLPLNDPLTLAHHASGWAYDPHNGGPATYCRLDSDGLHVGPAAINNALFCANRDLHVGDVDISVGTKVLYFSPGPWLFDDGFGIYVSGCGGPQEFTVRADGTWLSRDNVNPQAGRSIRAGVGAKNELLLKVRGSIYEFFVNGEKMGSVDLSPRYSGPDSSTASCSSNTIGFTASERYEIVFSDLVINAP
jgi:hypothetical protein